MEKKKKAVERLEDQLTKLEVQATDKVPVLFMIKRTAISMLLEFVCL